jgi:hypothetical protein
MAFHPGAAGNGRLCTPAVRQGLHREEGHQQKKYCGNEFHRLNITLFLLQSQAFHAPSVYHIQGIRCIPEPEGLEQDQRSQHQPENADDQTNIGRPDEGEINDEESENTEKNTSGEYIYPSRDIPP